MAEMNEDAGHDKTDQRSINIISLFVTLVFPVCVRSVGVTGFFIHDRQLGLIDALTLTPAIQLIYCIVRRVWFVQDVSVLK